MTVVAWTTKVKYKKNKRKMPLATVKGLKGAVPNLVEKQYGKTIKQEVKSG
jgi:hypothetical protein